MKIPPSDRDIGFVITTFALGLLFIALLQAFGPWLGKPDPRQAEINATMHRIVTLQADDALSLLRRPDGKPVMLVVYASWCPYCKRLMPELAELLAQHRLDNVAPVFLSVDERPDVLAIYLVHHDYQSLFTPYRIDSGLPAALRKTGSRFNGSIPYVAFFDTNGKPVAQEIGMVDKETLLNMAGNLH